MGTLWSTEDKLKLEQRLRELLNHDISLDEAIRELHQTVGLMFLYPAVQKVTSLGKREAKRVVVKATKTYLP